MDFNLEPSIGILGYGEEGKSTVRFLLQYGYRSLKIFDRHQPEEILPGCQWVSDTAEFPKGEKIKTLFRSPGIRPDEPYLVEFQNNGGLLTSQTEFFFQHVPKSQIIGVTGTVGKGTTCSLIMCILELAKRRALLAGNIGTPMLDVFPFIRSGDTILLELSSFQLSTLRKSPGTAVILKTTSEHLDWHHTQKEYWQHKANLVRQQESGDTVFFLGDSEGSRWIANHSKGKQVIFGKDSSVKIGSDFLQLGDHFLNLSDCRLKGNFNLENMAAAAAIAESLGVNPEIILKAIKSFQGLDHRLEFVAEKNGVSYYNDSYATRPDAALGAIRSFKGTSLALIMGGSEKNADFSELAEEISNSDNIKGIALIGKTAARIQKTIREADPNGRIHLKICENLEDAGDYLRERLSEGIILLSPACASFGLFENYKKRGEAFRKWVMGRRDGK